ncbi:hypothetical protein ADK57_15270 [Streptomyces sp. MMG1533]|nr:hypothetical protein ADK57_15270 [Streptomyces sp. MMG1533]
MNPRIGWRSATGACPKCRTGPVTSSPAYFHVAVHRSAQPSDTSTPARPASTETSMSRSSRVHRWDHNGPELYDAPSLA